MTDERLRTICEQDPGLDEEDAEEVLAELDQARQSEAAKDAVIKALADALAIAEKAMRTVRAALKLAGR